MHSEIIWPPHATSRQILIYISYRVHLSLSNITWSRDSRNLNESHNKLITITNLITFKVLHQLWHDPRGGGGRQERGHRRRRHARPLRVPPHGRRHPQPQVRSPLVSLQSLSDIVTSTLWQKSDIATISPIPNANFSTVALLPRDYLANLLDIVTILPSSWGSHNIR